MLDVAGDRQLNRTVKLPAGASNPADRRYFDRVWQTGLEPVPGRAWYTGVTLSFWAPACISGAGYARRPAQQG